MHAQRLPSASIARHALRGVLSALLAVSLLAGAAATALGSTLDDILDEGKVKIAVPMDVPPFGTRGKGGELEGYDIDVAKMIAEDMGVELEMVPVTGINRIPYLITGKVDIVVMIFGATPERAKSVSFTSAYAPYFIGVYGPAELPVDSAEDTEGYTVGVPRGTTQDITFTDMAPEGVKIIRYEDDATTTSALLSGQVDMIGTGNLVAREIARQNPDKNIELKFVLRMSPGHIGVRRNEFDLWLWLNTFIHYHKLNGDLDKLSRKWFDEPLPELSTF